MTRFFFVASVLACILNPDLLFSQTTNATNASADNLQKFDKKEDVRNNYSEADFSEFEERLFKLANNFDRNTYKQEDIENTMGVKFSPNSEYWSLDLTQNLGRLISSDFKSLQMVQYVLPTSKVFEFQENAALAKGFEGKVFYGFVPYGVDGKRNFPCMPLKEVIPKLPKEVDWFMEGNMVSAAFVGSIKNKAIYEVYFDKTGIKEPDSEYQQSNDMKFISTKLELKNLIVNTSNQMK